MVWIIIPAVVACLWCVICAVYAYKKDVDFKEFIDTNLILKIKKFKWWYRGISLKYRLKAFNINFPVKW